MSLDARELGPQIYVSSVAQAPEEVEQLARFEAQTRASWLIWGLVDLNEPQLAAVLRDQIAEQQGSAAAGVTITSQRTFSDGLLSALTLGFYNRRTVTIEGIVVRSAASASQSHQEGQ
ncbi:MAG: hypothetical protein H0U74_21955 [Bradymonadaceae bacterium]|nr:hypothetical protein [Lujinxingiaceae bacterium]